MNPANNEGNANTMSHFTVFVGVPDTCQFYVPADSQSAYAAALGVDASRVHGITQ